MVVVDGHTLRPLDVYDVAVQARKVEIPAEAVTRIRRSREHLERLARENVPIYGVTTGYGEMVYVLVDNRHESELQTNLVRSHAAGVGAALTREESRAIMAARLNALCRGFSAVRQELVERLALYLNEDIVPVIPAVGSLGASGDLGPLAHMAVTLIGEGYVFGEKGEKVPTREVLAKRGLEPLQLKFKEGLGLINGTSAMTGVGSLIAHQASEQLLQAEIITGLALEVLRASSSAFQPEGHELARPHKGQIDCAFNLRQLLAGSRLIPSHQQLREELDAQRSQGAGATRTEVYLQKAYTLRCVPQVLGAVRDTLAHTHKTLTVELNSANDNPLFIEDREVFHGGNFHGQPIAFVMDFTSIALTQLGVMSERRTNRLLNQHLSGGLPEFLVKSNPGLNCGFAGAQYPATALVAENRVTATPASIQSIPSNGDNQDVVSMGLISARNARRILENNYYILAVEALAAAQAVDLLGVRDQLGKAGRTTYETLRARVPMLEADRYMSDELYGVRDLLAAGTLLREQRNAGLELVGCA
ncbi:tyrosine 2,3-aminomutase [Hyalangium gracile]|uniref:tyrosine 2,3-aminomutase n=1 Tax=Hyalangium gracile TaxID=394092 RepID=UPI001CCBF269|nr:tyrosine 2,3-aminomutase [Hyalangium gracile]